MKDHRLWQREQVASFRVIVDRARKEGDAFTVCDHVARCIQVADLTEDIRGERTVGEDLSLKTSEIAVLLV